MSDLQGAVARYMDAIRGPGLDSEAVRLRRRARKLELQRARRARMSRVDYYASPSALQIIDLARGIVKAYDRSSVLNAILQDWAKRRKVFTQAKATGVRS
jgi:hypothetical protein